jgi:hypothetical protein
MSLRLLRRLPDRAALRSAELRLSAPSYVGDGDGETAPTQAFIPFGLVAEQDSSLEQGLLKLARKLAPQIEGSQS